MTAYEASNRAQTVIAMPGEVAYANGKRPADLAQFRGTV